MWFLMDTLKTLGMMGCSLFSGNGDIPEREVPSVIRNSFDTEFPEAVETDWEKKREDFEVDFEVNKADYSALFTKTGEMVMVKQEVELKSLPGPVNEVLQKEYAGYRIEEAEKIDMEGIIYFQIELEGKFLEKKEVFTED